MKSSEDLFILIKSLTKSEKRYFKLYSSFQDGDKKYIALFDAINSQKKFDEAELKKKLKEKILPKNFSREKNHLYELILHSMALYSQANSSSALVRAMIEQTKFLFNKGLFKQASSWAKKAEKEAERCELHIELLEISDLKRKIFNQTFELKSQDELEEYYSREKEIFSMAENNMEYTQLRDIFLLYSRDIFHARSKEDLDRYEQLFSSPLLRDERNALTSFAKRIFHNMHTRNFVVQGKFEEAYHHGLKLVEIAQLQPTSIKYENNTYASALRTLLHSQFGTYRYDEAEQTISELKKLHKEIKHVSASEQMPGFLSELHLYNITGQFGKGIPVIQEINDLIERNGIIAQYEAPMFTNFALIFFGCGEYEKSLHWINFLLNDANTSVSHDVYSFLKIFNTIVHYELGNISHLEYAARSAYRFLRRKKRLYKTEAAILAFITRDLMDITNNTQMVHSFTKLKANLEQIVEDPFEQKFLLDFDIISWLESKISQRPFAETIKEKAALKKKGAIADA